MNKKIVFLAVWFILTGINASAQHSGPLKIFIKTTPGILKYSDKSIVLPPNYQQLETEIINLYPDQRYKTIRFDRNDMASMIYGLAIVYFAADGIYNFYGGIKNYEKRHLINPFKDSTKNFFFAGGLTLFMIVVSAILCTDQFGCIPGRKTFNY